MNGLQGAIFRERNMALVTIRTKTARIEAPSRNPLVQMQFIADGWTLTDCDAKPE
jgi:hypothetical protein